MTTELRNKICINFFSNGNFIDSYKDNITSPEIISLANKIISLTPREIIFNYMIIQKTINTNQFGVKLVFKNCKSDPREYAWKIFDVVDAVGVKVFCYMYTHNKSSPSIKDPIYYLSSEQKLEDVYDNFPWKFSMDSFTQNCFTEEIHRTVNDLLIEANTFVGLDGESGYYYSANKHQYNYEILFTDSQFIWNDLQEMKLNCNLVNYTKLYLKDFIFDNDKVLLINISKHGLPLNLSEQINTMNFKQIVYISCDKESLIRDVKILSSYCVSDLVTFEDKRFVCVLEAQK